MKLSADYYSVAEPFPAGRKKYQGNRYDPGALNATALFHFSDHS